jgi:uncharacterized protein
VNIKLKNFEKLMEEKIQTVLGTKDPAHDLLHVKRVVAMARKLSAEEGADLNIVLPAAWLHDIVNLPKDHPDRKRASQMAADTALKFLKSINYPEEYYSSIAHAIEAHSFSANIKPESIEAKIVQDADRLDALGAIGMARLISVATQMGRAFYSESDPFFKHRTPDDSKFTIDHIQLKIKTISETMNTTSARLEAKKRFSYMKLFLDELEGEI